MVTGEDVMHQMVMHILGLADAKYADVHLIWVSGDYHKLSNRYGSHVRLGIEYDAKLGKYLIYLYSIASKFDISADTLIANHGEISSALHKIKDQIVEDRKRRKEQQEREITLEKCRQIELEKLFCLYS